MTEISKLLKLPISGIWMRIRNKEFPIYESKDTNGYLFWNRKDVLKWKKGEGQIANEHSQVPINNYYSLSLNIVEEDGLEIPIYGGHYPIKAGISQVWVNEAEVKAYRELLTHAIGTLISVQHGMFLQLQKKEQEEFTAKESNDILEQ